jgi:hypothetical protein
MEIDLYTDVYNHVITTKKFLKKAPELNNVKILGELDKILAMTV